MCLVCKDWQSGKLTRREAENALSELISFEEDRDKIIHYFETLENISEDDKD